MRWGRAADQTWSDYVRQLLAFGLGLVIVVDAVFIAPGSQVPRLVVGLLLMGIVPVDAVFTRFRGGGDK